jgi:signal peptidase I
MFSHVKKMLKIFLLTCLVLLFARGFLLEPGRVNGRSMETTFIDSEMFIVNKFALLISPPKRGDIVQFKGEDVGEVVIKRVIGLPNEEVFIYHNSIHITDVDGNEFVLDEPYLDDWIVTKTESGKKEGWLVPEQNYFLMGDNRPYSIDSRVYGSISRTEIYGLISKVPFLSK